MAYMPYGQQGEDTCCPPASAVYDPPQYVINDVYHPQVVPVIHHTQFINQHHCVPVPNHICTYSVKDVMCNVSSVRKSGKRNRKRSR